MDYYSVDPWDERRADLRDATNTAVMVNELRNLDNTVRVIAGGMGAKVKLRRDILHPRDLMPIFDPDERERERGKETDGQAEKRRASEYAERFYRERQEAKRLLGLPDGINPNAMEPEIVN